MTGCIQESLEFPAVKRRKVEAEFSGGEISSGGGVLLLRQADPSGSPPGTAGGCSPGPGRSP